MHELPVTESILEISLRHAQQAKSNRIQTIYLVIGQMATIIDDSVQFYWDIIAKGTIAEGANLVFRRTPVRLQCNVCSMQYTPGQDNFACPECSGVNFKFISGNEFFVEAIDVE